MNELREPRPSGAGWVRRESTNPLHPERVAESWWTHGAIVVGSSLVRANLPVGEGTGGRDAVVTEEQATSEDAWTALVGELKARRGRS